MCSCSAAFMILNKWVFLPYCIFRLKHQSQCFLGHSSWASGWFAHDRGFLVVIYERVNSGPTAAWGNRHEPQNRPNMTLYTLCEASCTTVRENMKKIQNMNKKKTDSMTPKKMTRPLDPSQPQNPLWNSLQMHGQDWAMPPCVDWLFGTAELPAATQRWLNCPWPALSCVQKPKNWWHWKTWGFQPLNLGFPTFLGPLSTLW